jgi:peptide/nickel transport system ATP-binding protein
MLLDIKNLEIGFKLRQGFVKAVDKVSYELDRGKTLGVVGESGCGKSVLCYGVMGLISPPGKILAGSVNFLEQDLIALTERQLQAMRGFKMAMIFQEPMNALNPVMTIGEQIVEQIKAHESGSVAKAKAHGIYLLDRVGIPSAAKRFRDYPHQLSGGMRQRAMIAMAISLRPNLLLADEPTTALDVTIQAQILDLLKELQEEYEMALQFISHDLAVISEIADQILVMYAGTVVEKGDAQTILNDPAHPYTQGLLQSLPTFDSGKGSRKLNPIKGQVPSLDRLPPGCPFQNRCPKKQKQCKEARPTLKGQNRQVACFFAEGS